MRENTDQKISEYGYFYAVRGSTYSRICIHKYYRENSKKYMPERIFLKRLF